MCAILLVLVGISIYWIFKYDEWYPNDIDGHVSIEHKSDDPTDTGLSIGTE
ncbi:MAG: hypothetical protein VX805_05515 [Pseudomonadota bacterium]|nr:hypothetical protein [Pseudomonadota bacterium]